MDSFSHCLETLGICRTQTWGLLLSYSRVISNYRVGIRDNSPPGCYGHILSFKDIPRPRSVNKSTLEKLRHNNLPHNPPRSALGNPRPISRINHDTSLNTSVKSTILILSIFFTTGSARPTLQVAGKTQEAH